MSETQFTVFMHPTLVDELDEVFSPMDGIIAIDQIKLELPKLHPGHAPKRYRNRPRRRIKVFRGRYDWYDLGFNYVQINNELHVIELWVDEDARKSDRQEVDVVLGQGPDEDYVSVDHSFGVIS